MNFFLTGGGCSAPVGVSTTLKPFDSQYKFTITGAVWSLDGTTQIDYTQTHIFTQIKKTQKHKHSPTEDSENKKLKTDNDISNKLNPIEKLNKRIDDKIDNLNCEDLGDNSKEMTEIELFCGLTENLNIPIDVITKCDSIGKELANVLIEKGALEVMKVTQDMIRNSVASKSS